MIQRMVFGNLKIPIPANINGAPQRSAFTHASLQKLLMKFKQPDPAPKY